MQSRAAKQELLWFLPMTDEIFLVDQILPTSLILAAQTQILKVNK